MQAGPVRPRRSTAGGDMRVLLLGSVLALLALFATAWWALQPPTPSWLKGEVKAYRVADYSRDETAPVYVPLSADIVQAVIKDNATFQRDGRDFAPPPQSAARSAAWLATETPERGTLPDQAVGGTTTPAQMATNTATPMPYGSTPTATTTGTVTATSTPVATGTPAGGQGPTQAAAGEVTWTPSATATRILPGVPTATQEASPSPATKRGDRDVEATATPKPTSEADPGKNRAKPSATATVGRTSRVPTSTSTPPAAPSDTPVPTAALPSDTPTPAPTDTPQPTPSATPSLTPSLTPSATPSETPVIATATEEATATPDAKPTHEPKPTDEPKPTKEPKATEEPKPTREAKPTDEPAPTREPKPTKEPNGSALP